MAKTLEELTITDDFMFGAVMRNPRHCKPLLELILNIKIRKIEYPELQKTVDERFDSRGIRLDVYVEDDRNTVYDVEIQTSRFQNLPKRMRYYQSMLDIHSLNSGENYQRLKKSYIIFICTFDPFYAGRYLYTFENRCLEDSNLALGDETAKLVLNTKGQLGEISEELKQFLRYMDGQSPESKYAKELETAVTEIRTDEKWRRDFMLRFVRDREKMVLGGYVRTVALVRHNRFKSTPETLADFLLISPGAVEEICATIDAHPDWDDEAVAEEVGGKMYFE